jgi:hypothetical protein
MANCSVTGESLASGSRSRVYGSGVTDRDERLTLLAQLGIKSSADKDAVARATESMELISLRCPNGFGVFAREVNALIRPLFNNRPD